MRLIANQIAQCVDDCITANTDAVIWRGILSEQQWKIVVNYDTETKSISLTARRRDGSEGDPE